MATDKNPNHPENDGATSKPTVQVRCAPGIYLAPEQTALLYQAFPQEEIILVKEEFRSGYSGAVVILVSVGAGRAPLVIKFADPHDLQQEYDAYVEYVRQVSPQNIAHLQGEPQVSADGQLGMLQYTFAGGESHLPTNSLAAYYESAGAEETAAVLNRIFRVYGRHWWANNRAQSYVLDEHYDRLLPVHLQATPAPPDAEAKHTIRNGESSVLVVNNTEIGQVIQLVGLQVIKSRNEGRRLTLKADPPDSEATAALRIRVESDKPTGYRPGDVVDTMSVKVTSTRMVLLGEAAQAALPGFEPQAKQFSLPGDNGQMSSGIVLPNPLIKLNERLYSVVETKMSVIHGDLNMQNVLVDAPTGFSWLIDFAETRVGPTLLDLQRLEVQVITKLMPGHGDIPLASVVEMMTRLHADPPLPAPPQQALQEPYTLLATIRRLARQYLIDDLDWNEYYYGLIVALVGALKYDELDDTARRLALVCAGAADSLIGQPLQTTMAADATQTELIAATGIAAAPPPAATPPVPVQPAPAQPATAAPGAGKRPPVVPPPATRTAKPAAAKPATGAPAVPVQSKSRRRGAGIALGAIAVLLVALAGIWFATRAGGPDSADVAGEDSPAAVAAVTPVTAEVASAGTGAGGADAPGDGDSDAGSGDAGSAGAAGVAGGPSETETAEPTDSATDEATDEPTVEPTDEAAGTPSPQATAESGGAVATQTTSTPTTTPTPTTAAVAASDGPTLESLFTLNVRSGPGAEFPIVGSLVAGTAAEVLGRASLDDGEWFQIEFPVDSGKVAWITGNPAMVEVSRADDVRLVARERLPTPPASRPAQTATPAQATTPAQVVVPPSASSAQGTIYYSAADSAGRDNIYRVPASGDGAPVVVVEQARQPSLSPNANLLAFQNMNDATHGVYSFDLNSQRKTNFSGAPEDGLPSWKPDGGMIVYASNREGDRAYRLYTTSAGGGDFQLGRGADPDWHPSKDLIVYRGCDDSGARCGLWTMATNGTSKRPLTDSGSDARPKWSPDGESVVFMSRDRDGNWEIYGMDADGANVRRLTNDPANDGHPVFSPDGRSIAFLSNRDGAWGIEVMPSSGGDSERIARISANLPDWLVHSVDWGE